MKTTHLKGLLAAALLGLGGMAQAALVPYPSNGVTLVTTTTTPRWGRAVRG